MEAAELDALWAREVPVISSIGSHESGSMKEAAQMDARSRANGSTSRGLQFGIGLGSKPISNFPKEIHLFRPAISLTGRMDKRSIGSVVAEMAEVAEEIARVTLKVGACSDYEALVEAIAGTREAIPGVEVVVSSMSPDALRRRQDVGIEPDVWQQQVKRVAGMNTAETISEHRLTGNLVDEAELSFPPPHEAHGDYSERYLTTAALADFGHDGHIEVTRAEVDVRKALSAVINMNSALLGMRSHVRVRGVYVENTGRDLTFDQAGRLQLHQVSQAEALRRQHSLPLRGAAQV